MEDSKGRVEVMGLMKVPVTSAQDVLDLLDSAAQLRTTSKTDANDESSRSHSVCQIYVQESDDPESATHGVLSLIDLAGSERGQDTKSHDRHLRMEAADINKASHPLLPAPQPPPSPKHKRRRFVCKLAWMSSHVKSHTRHATHSPNLALFKPCRRHPLSLHLACGLWIGLQSLLALKECIRALETGTHVSFRASKLTQVLKAAFTNKRAKTVMVAAVSPAAGSADHTINTLRYADRVKEKKPGTKIVLPLSDEVARDRAAEAAEAEERSDMGQIPEDEDDEEFRTSVDLSSPSDFDTEAMDAYDNAVHELQEAEEEVLALHLQEVERNAKMCVQEGQLLAKMLGKRLGSLKSEVLL